MEAKYIRVYPVTGYTGFKLAIESDFAKTEKVQGL